MPTGTKLRVVIVGGGFGGLAAAQNLNSPRISVTLIDRTNHHLFQPLLYQVATAALSPGDIAQPLRAILRGRNNVQVVMDTVTSVDLVQNLVVGVHGSYPFDRLILAPGARHSYFGNSTWEEFAPGLKTLEDALDIRNRILTAFERADECSDVNALRKHLRFVVVGGGPTGVEMAGAIAEIALKTMLPDFPRITRSDVTVLLVEASHRLLTSFHTTLSKSAEQQLSALGVRVLLGTSVAEITPDRVVLKSSNNDFDIETNCVIWAAGNQASPLVSMLPTPTDKQGRAFVQPNCSLPDYPHVFVIGDAARFEQADGTPLPGVAQTAMQMGVYVAKHIVSDVSTLHPAPAPFRYKDLGSMATIGRAKAIMEIGRIRASGFVAWASWAVLHIFKLISFRNRLKVLIEWMWYYVSYQPGARILYRANLPDASTHQQNLTTDLHEP